MPVYSFTIGTCGHPDFYLISYELTNTTDHADGETMPSRSGCKFVLEPLNIWPLSTAGRQFPSPKLDKSTGSSSSHLECDNRPRSQELMCVALFCMSGLPVEAVRRDGHYIL